MAWISLLCAMCTTCLLSAFRKSESLLMRCLGKKIGNQCSLNLLRIENMQFHLPEFNPTILCLRWNMISSISNTAQMLSTMTVTLKEYQGTSRQCSSFVRIQSHRMASSKKSIFGRQKQQLCLKWLCRILALWKAQTTVSNNPAETDIPSTNKWLSSLPRALGLMNIQFLMSETSYSFDFSRSQNLRFLLIAQMRFQWPYKIFCQLGLRASSKSATQTSAPAFIALATSFFVGGAVSSTCRLCKLTGADSTIQLALLRAVESDLCF